MGPEPRFAIFFERHIGIGLSWNTWSFPFHLSVAVPFVTMTVGFGKRRD